MRGSRVRFPPSAPFHYMPITPDQALAIKVKRWERLLHRLAVSFAIFAAIVMVFLLTRLFRRRIDDSANAREMSKREEADFHSRTISGGALDGTPGKNGKTDAPRKVQPVENIVDLSRKKTPEGASKPDKADVKPDKVTEKPRQPVTQVLGIENIPQKQKDIEKLIKEFFESTRVAEILPIVRDARRVRPLMEEYYERNPIKQRYLRGISWIMPIDEPGYRFAFVEAMFDNSLPLHVVVEETPAGFVLDWESSVQYSEMDWKQFIHDRPDQPKMFRVIASKPEGTPDDPADGQITMLQLRHPHESGAINARFDAKNVRFAPLIKQMKLNNWKDVPVTLRLYFPDTNAVNNEVQISGVMGKGWLNLEK